MYKIIYLIAFIISGCSYNHPICQKKSTSASIDNNLITLEVACSSSKRQVGLMGRKWLSPEDGMVFVFDRDDYHAFWMKDTLIPLSIAFINKDMSIVDIKEMLPNDLTPVSPKAKAVMAIEMNIHWFEEKQIKIGDKIVF